MAFPNFLRFPTELQWNVWSIFCPELTSQPFVLNFLCDDGKVKKASGLSTCTVAMRAVLAVHQESRHFALGALPDTLNFGGGFDLVRFRKERDVVIIESDEFNEWAKGSPIPRIIPGFSESVVNLLLLFYNDDMYTKKWLKTYCHFPNLRVLYDATRIEDHSDEEMAWCGSNYVHSAMDHMAMETCNWPDLIYHRHYARRHVQSPQAPAGVDVMTWALWKARKAGGLDVCQCFFTKQDLDHLGHVKVWPLVFGNSSSWADQDGSP